MTGLAVDTKGDSPPALWDQSLPLPPPSGPSCHSMKLPASVSPEARTPSPDRLEQKNPAQKALPGHQRWVWDTQTPSFQLPVYSTWSRLGPHTWGPEGGYRVWV